MMNDFAECVREEQRGAGKIENVLAAQAETAEAFDCGRGFTAFRTERRLDRNQAGPALRTCPSPPALLNWSMTDDACAWEQEIENVVEQSAFGETQRAISV